MILDTQAFAINWLEYSYAKQVGELGETSGRECVNKLSSVALTTIKGSKTSQPLIQEASAALIGDTRDISRGLGRSTLVIPARTMSSL